MILEIIIYLLHIIQLIEFLEKLFIVNFRFHANGDGRKGKKNQTGVVNLNSFLLQVFFHFFEIARIGEDLQNLALGNSVDGSGINGFEFNIIGIFSGSVYEDHADIFEEVL